MEIDKLILKLHKMQRARNSLGNLEYENLGVLGYQSSDKAATVVKIV